MLTKTLIKTLTKTELVIKSYVLPLGFFFFLSGILFFSSFSAYHTQIYIFLIVPTLILVLIKPRDYTTLFSSPAFITLIILLTYTGLSLLWNPPGVEDFKYLKRLLIILLFVLSIITLAKDNTDKLLLMLLIAAVIYSASAYYSIFQDYFINHKPISARIIGQGNLSNPLLSSHIYGIFSVFIIAYFFTRNRNIKQDVLLFIIFTGLILFTFLTGSRTPLLGLFTVMVFLIWEHKNKWVVYLSAFSLVLFAIYLFFNFELLTSRGTSNRPEIWSITLNYILSKPIFGYGMGSTIDIFISPLNTHLSDTHNIHLGLTYKLGFTGLIIWLTLLFFLFKIYIRNKITTLAQIGMALLIYGFFSGMTEGFGFLTRPKEIWFLTWLPVALLLASSQINNKQHNNNV